MKKWYDNEISLGIMKKKYLHPGETPNDFIPRLTSIFSDQLKSDAVSVLTNAEFLPAGRTLFGAGSKGKRKVSLSNCYILPNIEDNLESIYDTLGKMARIFSYGGGVGLSIDNLRPKDSKLNNAALSSSGAVSFLKLIDSTGEVISQNGRRGAIMVGLRCDHPDIEEFLNIKNNNEKLSSMNISIKFTDEFMEAVKNKQKYTLKFESLETGLIEREIDAHEFFIKFCETQWDWGDPGSIFIDQVKNYNLLSGYPEYEIPVSNPCAEYFGSGFNSCNLGSINLYEIIEDKFTDNASINYKKLRKITSTAIQMLDEILDYGYSMQPLDENRTEIDKWRSIGLGVFGLADAMVALGIRYGSEESRVITGEIMKTILHQALYTSAELARDKGTFDMFDLDKTMKSPLIQMFPDLHSVISQWGLRNGSLISVAPTGSISLFAGGFTGGVEPMYKIAYSRTSHKMEDEGKSFTIFARSVKDLLEYHKLPNISIEEAKAKFPFLIESQDVPTEERVMLQSVMQQFVDNAISSTVNLPSSATVQDIFDIYMMSWERKLKGITVFRDGCKRGNILGVTETKSETSKLLETLDEDFTPEYDTILPVSRKSMDLVHGTTGLKHTSCVTSMYVTVNREFDGNLFEVFTNPSGGCRSNINTITRLVSLALRCGIKVDKILEELRSNSCPACQVLRKQGRREIALSCASAIADAIEDNIKDWNSTKDFILTVPEDKIIIPELKNVSKVDIGNTTGFRACPECGEATLLPEGKCVTCSNCGWSKCE